MRRILAVLCTVAPFVAAAVAAFSARRDMRMLWMAIVATLVARIVFAMTVVKRGATVAVVIAFAGATVCASGVAIAAGARGAFGVAAVAVVLSGFATAGALLGRSSAVH